MQPSAYDLQMEPDTSRPYDPQVFGRHIQSALLLSLLEQGLLTHSQFDRCLTEVQRSR